MRTSSWRVPVTALRTLAIRIQHLEVENRTLRDQLDKLAEQVAPITSALFGLGPDTVSALLITIGDYPHAASH
ncbi:hypothetical protein BH11ACT6_BH11ACT6_09060 [soil metagenome]